MKKIYVPVITLIFFSFLISGMVSCKKGSFLGATNTTNLTQGVIFADSAYTEGFLANIYYNIGFASSPSRFVYDPLVKNIICGGLDAACDESEISHTFSTTALAFAIGSVNPANVTDDAYNTCYTQIRAANQLFKNISKSPLQKSSVTQRIAEARFLRAWYYFILLEHYGGVPIVGDTLYSYTQHIPAGRATFEQTVNYITSECDAAAQILPLAQTGPNLGRASGGACMALKARVLLYAASPLFNNKPSYITNQSPMDIAKTVPANDGTSKMVDQKPFVGYTDGYKVSRWQAAANAAAAVIRLNQYRLFTDSVFISGYGESGAFQHLFTQRDNVEYILQLDDNKANGLGANYLEGLFQPPSRTGANGAFPYQGIVDAFPMINGKDITDPTSGYNPDSPYTRRDPRLRYSIIYDQALLGVRTQSGSVAGYAPVDIFLNVINGVKSGSQDAVYQGTLTGYYNNKMLDPQSVSEGGLTSPTARCLPLMRYAEILLDFAEAKNEYDGPGLTTDSVYNYLIQIRKRAGISPGVDKLYGLQASMTQTQMRAAIQKERRLELAFEGNRFFDVRRWLIADQEENVNGQGMEVDHIGSTVTRTKFTVRKHNFTTKMYLWPFPQTEIGKGAGLVQNPGY